MLRISFPHVLCEVGIRMCPWTMFPHFNLLINVPIIVSLQCSIQFFYFVQQLKQWICCFLPGFDRLSIAGNTTPFISIHILYVVSVRWYLVSHARFVIRLFSNGCTRSWIDFRFNRLDSVSHMMKSSAFKNLAYLCRLYNCNPYSY